MFTIECGTYFHGIGEIIKDCSEDITITSLPEDGSKGSIITADIRSDGKIRITPGTSSVRIVPGIDRTLSKTIHNKKRPLLRKTKIGGNGGDSRKNIKTLKSSYNSNIQSLTIEELSSPIIHYSIFDMLGTLITEVKNVVLTNNEIPLTHLENDIYILKVQIENGDIFTKTIVKQ
ncbi:hypothetical protein A8C32_17180 [Flavivirga aquatica]|uniref:Secretion system C-terminal sorting domain-containing protein n=1 Tax=Flavivirga aquatica TaxID=1849968 RepID=A0A1E5T829_9FLAO|nr:T9SS type A sorting domain-containing protein [Flavivirga aquatica]OEK07529.1 hypothetical protein A8C32_17180 [Flavivirga aquatica]